MQELEFPSIDDFASFGAVDVERLKHMAIGGAASGAAMIASDLTVHIPNMGYSWLDSIYKAVLGLGGGYLLWDKQRYAAEGVAYGILGKAIYDLVRPHMTDVVPGFHQITVREESLLGQLTPEERALLSSVSSESYRPQLSAAATDEDVQGRHSFGAEEEEMDEINVGSFLS